MSQYVPAKSEQKNWNPGSALEFFDFISPIGPTGGRVVVDKYIIRLVGTITVAGALLDGRDVPRLLQNIQVESKSGRIRQGLSGVKTRAASFYFGGPQRHLESVSVPVGAAQAVDLSLVVHMTKPHTRRPKDFSQPADQLKKILISCNSLAGAAPAGVTLSAPVLSVYVMAVWHEEHGVEFKTEDQVLSVDFTSNTQGRVSTAGPVHDLFVMREGTTAGGGELITAITDARIEDIGTPLLLRSDLLADYTTKRLLGNTQGGVAAGGEAFLDPVREGKVLPVISSDSETSVSDGKIVESMKIDVGGGVAGCAIVLRQILPRDQNAYTATISKWGVNVSEIRVKTDKKTRRNPNDWADDELPFMPLSASLPGSR